MESDKVQIMSNSPSSDLANASLYAGTVKRHNLIIGSKHTTLSQWDDDLFRTRGSEPKYMCYTSE